MKFRYQRPEIGNAAVAPLICFSTVSTIAMTSGDRQLTWVDSIIMVLLSFIYIGFAIRLAMKKHELIVEESRIISRHREFASSHMTAIRIVKKRRVIMLKSSRYWGWNNFVIVRDEAEDAMKAVEEWAKRNEVKLSD
ncbi:hypothetical protein M6D81_01710 [Paenibacillus sp. J5C_2022]|uniref:hypothetical protein n=1 Tax=Paenibacillus sp. J5C2022 TaxID=2977129 RepID=UPI0021CE0BD5|nr:hypothetical protein [Paenibacillus sp. J5C2022]MCU6707412.1 hypothetical protein [Paenibacillus sp. J5C2022]